MADTIAALSTAPMKSGVAVLRISGDRALEFASSVFYPMGRKKWQPRVMMYGTIRNADRKVIDQALGVYFKAPNSYTGEDVVELHCHGSLAVMNAVLSTLYSIGARPALAGEFTKRAFLNGKLDLSQAEAVGDLIESQTEEAAINAAAQVGGALSRELGLIYDQLINLLAHFQAVVDYPDEDIEDFGLENAKMILGNASTRLRLLSEGYQRGKVLKEGVDCAIIGRPNVGKSSLMNALVGYDRAIVTPIAGTTRDIVEAYAKVGSVMLKIRDTAGIRETEDYVETIGVERALQAAKEASLILAMIDGSQEIHAEDQLVLEHAAGKRTILLINKIDLQGIPSNQHVLNEWKEKFAYVLPISAKSGEGLENLEAVVRAIYTSGDLNLDGTLITNARQEGACRAAAAALNQAMTSLQQGYPPDMVLYDVEQGMERIGDVLGKHTAEDVIERIFANFCVGK